ncbi:hypothetical protein [Cellulomonas sp.]|uniref:hypothetical protein n=1 Tax=Cellulomonas sp. TaxID=40001 RepID=UPI001B176D27|nr:hypothetical protein [Cellulomonas sp.]MBO9556754.1 hypothetical protein [Cellulomonas sp.]
MASRYVGRAGRVLDTNGRTVGMVFLEWEQLTRRVPRGERAFRGQRVARPAIHQHYWEPGADGDYEDAIIDDEGLVRSEGLWDGGLVEVKGEYAPVVWCDDAESREIGLRLLGPGG